MAETKKAYTPAEGVYYVVPRKDGHVTTLAQRSDEVEEPAHMFFWDKVCRWLASEYGIDEEELATNYQGLPRGRVQKEIDKDTFRPTGRYVILHGGDVPVSTIRYSVIQDFGLGELESKKMVTWMVEPHEKMDKGDQKVVQKVLARKRKGRAT